MLIFVRHTVWRSVRTTFSLEQSDSALARIRKITRKGRELGLGRGGVPQSERYAFRAAMPRSVPRCSCSGGPGAAQRLSSLSAARPHSARAEQTG